jgi:hypothetical protein
MSYPCEKKRTRNVAEAKCLKLFHSSRRIFPTDFCSGSYFASKLQEIPPRGNGCAGLKITVNPVEHPLSRRRKKQKAASKHAGGFL